MMVTRMDKEEEREAKNKSDEVIKKRVRERG